MRLTKEQLEKYTIGDIIDYDPFTNKRLQEKRYIVGTDRESKLCWIEYDIVTNRIH